MKRNSNDSFSVINPSVIEWLESYTGLLPQRAYDTVREGIRKALIEGIKAGESGRKIEMRVLEALGAKRDPNTGKLIADDNLKYIAEMIAWTETARAQSAGQDRQLREAGATRKVWRAAADCCEFCAELDGTTIGVEESFFKRGDTFELLPVEGDPRTLRMNFSDADVDYPPLHGECRCILNYLFDH